MRQIPGGHGLADGRDHVAMQAGDRRDRIARQRENHLTAGTGAEPHRFAWPLSYPVEYLADTQCREHLGQKVEFTHGDAAAQHQDVRLFQLTANVMGEVLPVVGNVQSPDRAEVDAVQGRGHRNVVGAADLMAGHRLARHHEFVTGTDDRDTRTLRDRHRILAGCGEDRNVRAAQQRARSQQGRAGGCSPNPVGG